jgi:hypothetical protein
MADVQRAAALAMSAGIALMKYRAVGARCRVVSAGFGCGRAGCLGFVGHDNSPRSQIGQTASPHAMQCLHPSNRKTPANPATDPRINFRSLVLRLSYFCFVVAG